MSCNMATSRSEIIRSAKVRLILRSYKNQAKKKNLSGFLFDKNDQTDILYLSLIIPDHTFRNFLISPGSSVVEHLPEEQSVGGSIPSLGTSHLLANAWQAFLK